MSVKQKIIHSINKYRQHLIRLGSTLGIVLLGVVIAYLNTLTRAEPEIKPPVLKQINVVAVSVTPSAHTPILKSTATVEAWQESQLAAQVGGRLEWLCDCLEVGTTVKKDTVLARIEAVDYQVAVAQAKQTLADAKQRIAEEEARAEQARADWTDLNLGEPSDLALRKPQLEAANATLKRRQLELELARRNLARTKIKAPYNGVITSRSSDVGNFINTGISIGKILNTDKVHINLSLNANDVNKLDPENTQISVRQSGADNLRWKADLVRVDSVIDPRTRLVNVIAEVKKPFDLDIHPAALRVGSFITAEFSGKPIENTYALPASAVLTDNTVFVVQSDNTLTTLNAIIKHRNPQEVLVTFPDAGDQPLQIVTEGQAGLAPRLEVSILGSESDSTLALKNEKTLND